MSLSSVTRRSASASSQPSRASPILTVRQTSLRMAHDPKPPQPKLAGGGVERPRNTSFWRTEKSNRNPGSRFCHHWRGGGLQGDEGAALKAERRPGSMKRTLNERLRCNSALVEQIPLCKSGDCVAGRSRGKPCALYANLASLSRSLLSAAA